MYLIEIISYTASTIDIDVLLCMIMSIYLYMCIYVHWQDPSAFSREMSERFHTFQGHEDNTMLSDCITDLLNIVRKHRVSFNGDVFNVIMTTVVLEGWASKLNPNINLQQMIKNVFSEMHKMDVFKETLQTWKPWFF